MNQPIQRKSLATEVADLLKHRIRSGAFAVDAKLPPEPELMKEFGVGRSTVREAIKLLSNAGFVVVKHGLGTFVVSRHGTDALQEEIKNADFAEIFEVRRILELQIIEKSVANRSGEDVALLHKNLDDRKKYASEDNLLDCIEADINFHINIANACGNRILASLYKTLSQHLVEFFNVVHKDTKPFLDSQEAHELLLEGIEEQNIDKAQKAAQVILGRI
ncbi:FCD domain-containing protein [Soonwooa sp.]|uniref:FadR/GntR family transcriptional regulator n=1 Tax=Soonwooa sp. TaxID=1938592 RepID=UPI002621806A|nr:FCD domain-containing protein [Soonwooa sp.]